MEHSSISGADHRHALAANLSKTYLAIASGVPGTELEVRDEWQAATNEFSHPICNFAVLSNAPPPLPELHNWSLSRKFFNIYLPHSGNDNDVGSTLIRSGFRKLYTLHQMAGTSEAATGNPANLREAVSIQEKEKLAEFMAFQFFGSQSPAVRRQITYASLSSPDLKLYESIDVTIRQRPLGAVMLHRTPGVLGLYNLCVAPVFRGRGVGAAIVNASLLQSGTERVIVGLQCDPALTDWYEHLGLRRVGIVDVFGLERA